MLLVEIVAPCFLDQKQINRSIHSRMPMRQLRSFPSFVDKSKTCRHKEEKTASVGILLLIDLLICFWSRKNWATISTKTFSQTCYCWYYSLTKVWPGSAHSCFKHQLIQIIFIYSSFIDVHVRCNAFWLIIFPLLPQIFFMCETYWMIRVQMNLSRICGKWKWS